MTPNLTTSFLGLTLKSPIIAASSGMTQSVAAVKALEEAGVGAVILKSIFEEQISSEAGELLKDAYYPEAADYINLYAKSNSLEAYKNLIKGAKEQTSIPIIASINCYTNGDWIKFAKEISDSGADAIELNIFSINTNKHLDAQTYEDNYYSIVRQAHTATKLPILVKISPYFTNILDVVDRLKSAGASGVTLFNRFFQTDIDLDNLEVVAGHRLTNADMMYNTLRWTALCSGGIKDMNFSASTGIHSAETATKMLLAGASTVQVCSAIYNHGPKAVSEFNAGIIGFMKQHNFKSIEDFKGRLSHKGDANTNMYERSQFMKYFSSED
ncbi:MAG: dihydroorotate dehydrogenase-like protein [Bacteroidales bacterium]|jgi:dihydroorotate dehydrogenase (fumarate)|nr:dihydroorotate dehydrogenase-like protein [Bacteroidales bacterium]